MRCGDRAYISYIQAARYGSSPCPFQQHGALLFLISYLADLVFNERRLPGLDDEAPGADVHLTLYGLELGLPRLKGQVGEGTAKVAGPGARLVPQNLPAGARQVDDARVAEAD